TIIALIFAPRCRIWQDVLKVTVQPTVLRNFVNLPVTVATATNWVESGQDRARKERQRSRGLARFGRQSWHYSQGAALLLRPGLQLYFWIVALFIKCQPNIGPPREIRFGGRQSWQPGKFCF